MRKILIIIYSCLAIVLTSCKAEFNRGVDSVFPTNDRDRVAADVLECFKTKDKEKLKDMFCDVAKESDLLDEQIQEAMEFFDGEVISFNKTITGGEQTSYEDKQVRKQKFDAHMVDIETDEGKIYSIRTFIYTVNKDAPEKVGISEIIIEKEGEEEITIGTYVR